jgi:hypothetical protein
LGPLSLFLFDCHAKTIATVVFASRLATTSLLSAGALGSVVFATGQPAKAAGFTGVCPVLGTTQPTYPTPFEPPTADPLAVNPVTIALPQEPVRVTVDGVEYPICAVYMSINDSNTLVANQIPINELPNPGETPNDLLFPDLRNQPWTQKPGANEAVAFANSLIENGFWDLPTSPPSHYVWKNDGFGLLVNENTKKNKNDSEWSPFFLWKYGPQGSTDEGQAQPVYWNEKSGKWLDNSDAKLDPNVKKWYWVLDAPGTDVPGPLPLLGAGAAFGWSRRLRQRMKQASAG